MSMTSLRDRSPQSPAGAGPGRGPAVPGAGPGKRTLTEDLGAGDALPDTQRARFEQPGSAPGAATDAGNEPIGELTAEQIGAEPYEPPGAGPDVPVRDTDADKQAIAGVGQQLPPQGGADGLAGAAAAGPPGQTGHAAQPAPGGGDGGGEASPELTTAVTAAQSDARDAVAQS